MLKKLGSGALSVASVLHVNSGFSKLGPCEERPRCLACLLNRRLAHALASCCDEERTRWMSAKSLLMIRGVPVERAAAAVCTDNFIDNLLSILVGFLDSMIVVLPFLAGADSLQQIRGAQQDGAQVHLAQELGPQAPAAFGRGLRLSGARDQSRRSLAERRHCQRPSNRVGVEAWLHLQGNSIGHTAARCSQTSSSPAK